jgi:hypothetical protein
MRRWLVEAAAIVAAMAVSEGAWIVAAALTLSLLPLELVLVALLVCLGLWLLAWRTPTPWWALVLAIAALHVVYLVRVVTEARPEGFEDRRGLDLAVSAVVYLLVVAAGAVGARRGSLRRSRDLGGVDLSVPV